MIPDFNNLCQQWFYRREVRSQDLHVIADHVSCLCHLPVQSERRDGMLHNSVWVRGMQKLTRMPY